MFKFSLGPIRPRAGGGWLHSTRTIQFEHSITFTIPQTLRNRWSARMDLGGSPSGGPKNKDFSLNCTQQLPWIKTTLQERWKVGELKITRLTNRRSDEGAVSSPPKSEKCHFLHSTFTMNKNNFRGKLKCQPIQNYSADHPEVWRRRCQLLPKIRKMVVICAIGSVSEVVLAHYHSRRTWLQ